MVVSILTHGTQSGMVAPCLLKSPVHPYPEITTSDEPYPGTSNCLLLLVCYYALHRFPAVVSPGVQEPGKPPGRPGERAGYTCGEATMCYSPLMEKATIERACQAIDINAAFPNPEEPRSIRVPLRVWRRLATTKIQGGHRTMAAVIESMLPPVPNGPVEPLWMVSPPPAEVPK
jgi:hypothetical protein